MLPLKVSMVMMFLYSNITVTNTLPVGRGQMWFDNLLRAIRFGYDLSRVMSTMGGHSKETQYTTKVRGVGSGSEWSIGYVHILDAS